MLGHATIEIHSASIVSSEATKKLPGKSSKRPWLPLIRMDDAVKAEEKELFTTVR